MADVEKNWGAVVAVNKHLRSLWNKKKAENKSKAKQMFLSSISLKKQKKKNAEAKDW